MNKAFWDVDSYVVVPYYCNIVISFVLYVFQHHVSKQLDKRVNGVVV